MAAGDASPVEVPPPQSSRTQSPRKYWSRKAIAEWLVERLSEDAPTLVGIDHGFSFPLRYFEAHHLKPDWPAFLDDFQHHWPTNEDHTYVDFIRDGVRGKGAERMGDARWRWLTELRTGRAKSVFHFDVQGSVAKSTHAGIPARLFPNITRARMGAIPLTADTTGAILGHRSTAGALSELFDRNVVFLQRIADLARRKAEHPRRLGFHPACLLHRINNLFSR